MMAEDRCEDLLLSNENEEETEAGRLCHVRVVEVTLAYPNPSYVAKFTIRCYGDCPLPG